MNLRLRYSLRKQGLEDLYDVYDADTGDYIGDPLPYEQALKAKRDALETLKAIDGLSNIWGWAAQA